MTEHAVVIAGGGPTGLMLAGELALAEVDVVIVERRASQDLPGTRAGGLHARTIEVFDQRGIADRFLAEGQVAQVAGFAGVRLDISDFPTRHPYGTSQSLSLPSYTSLTAPNWESCLSTKRRWSNCTSNGWTSLVPRTS